MSAELEQDLQKEGSDTRPVQTNGEVTIPKDLRDDYGLRPGRRVVVSEREDEDVLTIRPIDNE